MPQRCADYIMKVAALCTVTVVIGTFVIICLDSPFKKVPGFLDLIPYSRQIHQPEWRPVFIDQVFERNSMESKVVSNMIKAVLRKIVALLDQIKISILNYCLNHKKLIN